MKRIVSFFLAIVLALPLSLGCFAANQEAESAADMLYELGLFQGKGTDADGRPDRHGCRCRPNIPLPG